MRFHRALGVTLVMLLGVSVNFSDALAESETDYYDNAVGMMGQKKFASAEAEFCKSIRADPRYKDAWEGLAAALTAQGKDASVVKKMAQAAPAARAGTPPALTAEQSAALGEAAAGNLPLAPILPLPAVADAQPPIPPPAADPHVNVPDVPLEHSDIVTKSADGNLGVTQKDGKPFDGTKLSVYDAEIFSPQLACTSDGTVHLAFVERQSASPYAYFVFHRQSSDGGKTWTESKNLSENMAGFNVGNCMIAIDAKDRVHVVWRSSLKEGFPVLQTPAGNGQHNLVYRVLDHGKWSKIIHVHPPGSAETQDNGSVSFTAVTDAAGRVQVIWNSLPDEFHPEQYMVVSGAFKQHCNGINRGLVFEATLDGAAAPKPRELFCVNFHEKPAEGKYGKYCDDLDAIDGFADVAGSPHFIAKYGDENFRSDKNTQISLIENGKATHVLTLPQTFRFDANPPKLLVDAAGKKHIIAQYEAGEHPSIRDYLAGSDEEPNTLISAKPPKGTLMGFQAFQGPHGKMIVLMQSTDEGYNDKGDTWVTTSTGDAWTAPVCITNNAGREKWWSKDTGVLHGVSGGSRFGPGPGAAVIGKDGHLLVALINVETGSFGQSAGGVVYMSGSTSTPRLSFYRF